MNDERKRSATTGLRLGHVGEDAAQLAEQLGNILGRRITLGEYVRDALDARNSWARRVLAATEIPSGDIIITGAEVNAGGRDLLPGIYRIAGTTDLITIEGPAEDPDLNWDPEGDFDG